ncbi:hypothetical protein ACHWQZ_G015319 [Mnemiopsis leidyi]
MTLICLILLLQISACATRETNVTMQKTIEKRSKNALSLSEADEQYTNIAHLGTAEQISTHNWGEAYRCIDGNTDGDWKNDDTNSICITVSSGLNWWRLTFLQSYYIHKVVIYPRSSVSLSGYTLKVIGYETNLDPTEIFSTYAEFNNVDRTGKALELQFTGKIQLSEVEVYGPLQTVDGGWSDYNDCNPTLWKFIDCLRAEQSLTDARHTKRLLRERREPRAPKWVRYDEQLQRIVDAYDDYSNKMDYLKAFII